MKKILSLVTLILLVLMMFSTSAFADSHPARIVDDAGVLSASELSEIQDYLDRISDNQNFDVTAVFIDKGYDSNQLLTFADDFYDYGGYGMGEQYSGCMLAVDMGSREFTMSTCGWGITALTDYGIEYIYDDILGYAKDGDWVGAINRGYADNVETFVKSSYEGKIFDNYGSGYDNYGKPIPKNKGKAVAGGGIAAIILGALNGLRSSSSKKAKLKSVARKYEANSYVKEGSMHITRDMDRFLYRNLAVTERPKPSSNSGGGSTTHTSSSGRSHGGGGGRKF